MQVTSALAGCKEANKIKPAFLSFKIGGVQNFIAEARTTRDLWSGSYLLSWLMAVGLKRLSELAGPDAVIFPSLFGQPLFDLHWKAELWDQLKVCEKPVYDGSMMTHDNASLTTPNFVNTFLAVVPAAQAKEIATAVSAAMQHEWEQIADQSWHFAEKAGVWENLPESLKKKGIEARWDEQTRAFLKPEWQVLPWPDSLEAAIALGRDLLPRAANKETSSPLERVEAVIDYAEKWLKKEHRDSRYYDKDSGKLNNIGLAWSVLYDTCIWLLDASRQTKAFDAKAPESSYGTHCNKDDLNGRDEAIAGGPGWADAMKHLSKPWNHLFKHDDWVGAPNFIKRVWPYAYLENHWGIDVPVMPTTHNLAKEKPDVDDIEPEDSPDQGGYFAVIALDGDEMGKWVSGAKNPKFATQLADYNENGNPKGAVAYLKAPENCSEDYIPSGESIPSKVACSVLEEQRPVSPSFSLQFSECLANFALRCARSIVEAHQGKLLYAGGDDVLAMLPATTAMACAEDLQAVFRGRSTVHCTTHLTYVNPDGKPAHGFVVTTKDTREDTREDPRDQLGKEHVFIMVPGPATSCSVGIAIAHAKQPLQDVVREAQSAEKRAKAAHGRAAVAVSLIKRSGETIEWGCQWASGGLELYQAIYKAMQQGTLSNKFPYRVAELLSPYLQETAGLNKTAEAHSDFNAAAIIQAEFAFALERQSFLKGKEKREQSDSFCKLLEAFLEGTAETWGKLEESRLAKDPTHKEKPVSRNDFHLNAVIGLCQTTAFIRRQKGDDASTPD